MGGYGSTRWGWHTKKRTVGQCLTLDLGSLILKGILDPVERPQRTGSIIWSNTRTDEEIASVGFDLHTDGATSGLLTLRYTATRWNGEKEHITEPIPLVTTAPHFGGVRWWFKCPLVVRGVPCNRRALKLYKSPGGLYFGCRHCQDLTYTSSQEAHQYDRLYADLAASMQDEYPDMTGRDVARVLSRIGRI